MNKKELNMSDAMKVEIHRIGNNIATELEIPSVDYEVSLLKKIHPELALEIERKLDAINNLPPYYLVKCKAIFIVFANPLSPDLEQEISLLGYNASSHSSLCGIY